MLQLLSRNERGGGDGTLGCQCFQTVHYPPLGRQQKDAQGRRRMGGDAEQQDDDGGSIPLINGRILLLLNDAVVGDVYRLWMERTAPS